MTGRLPALASLLMAWPAVAGAQQLGPGADELPPGIREALGDQGTAAPAEATAGATPEPASPPVMDAQPKAPTIPLPSRASEATKRLVDLLKKRQRHLQAREAELENEEERLRELRAEVEARLEELKALRGALDERIDEFSTNLEARRKGQVGKLVKAMATMPPERAAGVAAAMDEGVVVRVFDRMKGRSMARILANMPARKAARIGQRLTMYRSGTKAPDKAKKPKKKGKK